MTQFRQKTGTKSAIRYLKNPFPDITEFDALVQSIIKKNPLGCTSYMSAKKNHPPVMKVREMYTAKFIYKNANGKRIGHGLDMYNSIEGYENGIASVISNMANIAAHDGKVRHIPAADLFSVTLKCHDQEGGMYFLSIARDRMTVSSYGDEAIRRKVERWADGVPALRK
jgi:uncharacterized protein YegP (UPF0339 family)